MRFDWTDVFVLVVWLVFGVIAAMALAGAVGSGWVAAVLWFVVSGAAVALVASLYKVLLCG